jgi:hypothetical protein
MNEPPSRKEETRGRVSAGEAWRKRVGVEPTKDRLTAPPGFEVRTPHQGRFSSTVKQFSDVARIARRTKRHRRDLWAQLGHKRFWAPAPAGSNDKAAGQLEAHRQLPST